MKMLVVKCYNCSQEFKKYKGKVNEAIKFGWNQYCSPECQFTKRLKGEYKTCQNCGKKIWRIPKELKANRTGRFFCNTSCAAIFNNHIRVLNRPPITFKTCAVENCNNLVKDKRSLFCSRKCGCSPRKRTVRSLQKEVLFKIRKFYKLNNRIPVKKEMYDAYRKARDAFGTWNKAIEAAGFSPNPVMFSKKYIARDGHVCDSLAEKIIDEWLYSKGIAHERSVSYPELEKMTCDFVVGKFFIEFFGLEGQHREYTRHVKKKRQLSRKYKLKLIELKPTHLFPKNKLDQVLKFLT